MDLCHTHGAPKKVIHVACGHFRRCGTSVLKLGVRMKITEQR